MVRRGEPRQRHGRVDAAPAWGEGPVALHVVSAERRRPPPNEPDPSPLNQSPPPMKNPLFPSCLALAALTAVQRLCGCRHRSARSAQAWPTSRRRDPPSCRQGARATRFSFTAGEAKEERMFIVRGGQGRLVLHAPRQGRDQRRRAHAQRATFCSPTNTASRKSPPKKRSSGITTRRRRRKFTPRSPSTGIGGFVQNGDPAKARGDQQTTGAIERESVLPVKPSKCPRAFPPRRLTDAGRFLSRTWTLGQKPSSTTWTARALW